MEDHTKWPQPPKGFGSRHLLVILTFIGVVCQYTIRFNISVAIVAMVNQSAILNPSGSNGSEECPQNVHNNTSAQPKDGEFNWSPKMEGIVLGSLPYGYLVGQIPGGMLADKIGAKHVIGCALFGMAIGSMLTPLAARVGVGMLIGLRVVQGIFGSVFFPGLAALLGQWIPPLEVSKYNGFISSGCMFGTVVSMVISGLLCQSDFLGGWPSTFYVFGAVTCVWYIAWLFLAFSEPRQHPRISEEEKDYIRAALMASTDTKRVKRPTPWKAILHSVPVWANVAAMAFPSLLVYTCLTSIPQYMREILKFNIDENGYLSAVPYVASFIIAVFSGFSADWLRAKHIMSTTTVRKFFTILSILLPSAFLVAVGYVGCDQTLAVVLLTLSVGTNGFTYGGKDVNTLDIAPYHAGTVCGIQNLISNIPGILAPYLVGYLTDKQQSVNQWTLVFYINAGVAIFGMIIFTIFGSGERQEWDKEPQHATERDYLIQAEESEGTVYM